MTVPGDSKLTQISCSVKLPIHGGWPVRSNVVQQPVESRCTREHSYDFLVDTILHQLLPKHSVKARWCVALSFNSREKGMAASGMLENSLTVQLVVVTQ